MSIAQPRARAHIPRDYNFAADILKRNLDAGRGDKTPSSIIAAHTLTPISPIASSVSAMCCARSASAARSAF